MPGIETFIGSKLKGRVQRLTETRSYQGIGKSTREAKFNAATAALSKRGQSARAAAARRRAMIIAPRTGSGSRSSARLSPLIPSLSKR